MTIKIFNLSQDITDSALEKLFRPYGIVDTALVDRNVLNGRSKGNGIVEMPIENQAMQAIASLDRTIVDGKRISVQEWKQPTS